MCTYIIGPKSKQKIFYVSHILYTHNKKIIPNMHGTKSVDTESSELCHHVSTQKVLDFWMRMLQYNGASELYREHSMGTFSYPERGLIMKRKI